ncbi:hypothetical protein ACFLYH_00685 [Candidatus Dependentiae bacterium]
MTKKLDKSVKTYTKGNLDIKVHMDEKEFIHGYPYYPQKYG